MKKFAMLLMALSVSMFTLGCDKGAAPKKDDKAKPAAEAGKDKPAEGAPAEKPAEPVK